MSPFDGARARARRIEVGLPIEDLASPSTVRHAENGTHQPRPRVAVALAHALGTTVADLAAAGNAVTLREVRRRMGLTQDQVARQLGTVRQMVSRVERGIGGVGCPAKWAAAYGLTLAQWLRAHRASQDAARNRVTAKTQQRR